MENQVHFLQFFDDNGEGIAHRDWAHVPRAGETVVLLDVCGKAQVNFKVKEVIWADNRNGTVMPRVHLKEL